MAATEALDDDHREALERVVGGETTPEAIRQAAVKGRINGTMETIALVLTRRLAGRLHREARRPRRKPDERAVREVLPGIIERHGLAITRMMLASTVAGEAAASAPSAICSTTTTSSSCHPRSRVRSPRRQRRPSEDDPEREAIKAKRVEARRRKQEQAALRREQSRRDRGRA